MVKKEDLTQNQLEVLEELRNTEKKRFLYNISSFVMICGFEEFEKMRKHISTKEYDEKLKLLDNSFTWVGKGF